MSVIVMGMEMPIGCDGCKLRYRHQGAYVTDHCFYNMKIVDPWTFGRSRNGDKPDWCPIRPLPENHGPLIDRNELEKAVLKWLPPDPCGREEKEYPFETDICVSMMMEIEEQETIVEAEGG